MNSDISVIRDASELALQCRDFADTEVLGSVGSTNQYLLDQRPAALSRPRFVWTHLQTQGRGRRGRVWVGPPQHSLMFSMQFLRKVRSRDGAPPQAALTGLPIAVGVALAECLSGYSPGIRLKWPNDLQRAGRKFGGILIETRHLVIPVSRGGGLPEARLDHSEQPKHVEHVEHVEHVGQTEQVVIGVGLNLYVEPAWQRSIGQPVCGLFDTSSYPLRATIAAQLARSLCDAWMLFQVDGVAAFVSRWSNWDALFGLGVRVLDGERVLLEGVASGLSPSGTLLVRTEAGQREVSFGDVSVRSSSPEKYPDQSSSAN